MEEDKWVACQLLLIAVFGLRSREAWLFRPHLATNDAGQITITKGTKGGRPRTLPLRMTPEQSAALEEAKKLVQTPSESMIPRGYTLKQWDWHYYRVCRKIGLTREGYFKVTPHSLRHGVLLDIYEALTGVPAPVRGGSSGTLDRHEDRAAREIVAEFAGHSRPSVSAAYVGGVRRARSSSSPSRASTPETSLTSGGNTDAVPTASVTDAQKGSVETSASNTDTENSDGETDADDEE